MMKYTITAAVAATFTASAALAGGVSAPYIEPAPQVVYVAPAMGWTGGYVGANLNYGTGKLKSSGALAGFLTGNGYPTSSSPDGASGALRLGYDWQRGAGVFGLGAEYNFGKYKDTINGGFGPINTEIKNAATVFARAGYAMNDNFMAYGLLGYTWAKATVGGPLPTQTSNLSGGTIGLGGEYKFSSNMSTYLEYTYTDFGTVDTPLAPNQLKANLGQVKLGLNYRF